MASIFLNRGNSNSVTSEFYTAVTECELGTPRRPPLCLHCSRLPGHGVVVERVPWRRHGEAPVRAAAFHPRQPGKSYAVALRRPVAPRARLGQRNHSLRQWSCADLAAPSQRIPDELAAEIAAEEALVVGSHSKVWRVGIGWDGDGALLGRGWRAFAAACGIESGWFLVLRHRSRGLLTLKAFDDDRCLTELGAQTTAPAGKDRFLLLVPESQHFLFWEPNLKQK